ncbi:MAG: hypothetical protein IT445_13940 [Phycisphaeraceae bacterium]|nr:hypothetical protein [Phycisphaeraceae bacterium]
MSRRLDLTDWRIDVGDAAVLARPGGKVIGRQLWLSLLCVLMAVGIIWYCGLPPGSRRMAARQQRVQAMQDSIAQIETQARRLSTGVSDVSRQMAEREAGRAADLRRQLESEQAKLAQMRPTLGLTGDATYWISLVLLALVAVGVPLSGRFERVTMMARDGKLRVRTFLSLNRGGQIDLRYAGVISVHARRVVLRQSSGTVTDAGWLWSIYLIESQQSAQPLLEIRVEHSDLLPARPEQLSGVMRQLVAFFQRHSNAVVGPTVTTDVMDASRGRVRFKSRRHTSGR